MRKRGAEVTGARAVTEGDYNIESFRNYDEDGIKLREKVCDTQQVTS